MSPEEDRPPSGGEPPGASAIPGAESPGTPTSPGGEPPGGRASVPEASRTLGSQPASRTLAWLRQFAKLWGFALFCIFVVYFFREVALPFLFAILVAYILAPLVDRIASYRIGGRPFPRALAVILLYINILAALSLFIGYFIPKLSGDFARLFREAPQLFSRSQITITRTTRLFWFGCGMGGLSMNSRSPSKRMRRVCSPPTQASFQAASTLVMTLPSSTR